MRVGSGSEENQQMQGWWQNIQEPAQLMTLNAFLV